MLILPILIPLLGAGIIASLGRWPNIRETASVLTALILFCLVCSFVPHVQAGESLRISLFSLVPGLTVTFALEPLGVLFALIASGLWILTAIYAAGSDPFLYLLCSRHYRRHGHRLCGELPDPVHLL